MSSSAPKRIVLVEATGEVVFEGVSVLESAPPPPPHEQEAEDAEPCPPTKRSPTPSESGFFAAVPRSKGERAA